MTGTAGTAPSATADPHARLLARTRRRLAAVVLVLVGALVLAIGVATALTAIRVIDAEADRALQTSSDAFVARLDGSVTAAPGGGADQGSEDEGVAAQAEQDERPPAESDTFHLVLAADGTLVANPARVPLGGLPDADAVTGAAASGSDLRTVDAGGTRIRLLTVPVTHEGAVVGYVQSGYVLTLRDRQIQTIVLTVVIVGLLGLLGAAVVTVVVVGRALVPIRAAFDTERRFIADASHEIRTPAAIIRASAEVLEREDLVKEGGRPLVADMVAETDRLGRLVDDLLALDASDRGTLVLDRRPTDLRALVAETVARARPLAAERGVAVAGPTAGAPVVADADPDRLIQVLLVLIDNATRHAPAGTPVTVDIVPAGSNAEIRVEDRGPGVPSGAREAIFEPFARLPGESRTRGSGSGLGLAIARRIVEMHDGSIGVTDAPGGGARFAIVLPLARGQGTAAGERRA
jgi:signal transduction histidine kinase